MISTWQVPDVICGMNKWKGFSPGPEQEVNEVCEPTRIMADKGVGRAKLDRSRSLDSSHGAKGAGVGGVRTLDLGRFRGVISALGACFVISKQG